MSDLMEALDREIAQTEDKLAKLVSVRELLVGEDPEPKPKAKATGGKGPKVKDLDLGNEPDGPEVAERNGHDAVAASRADQIRALLGEGLKPADIAKQLGIKVNYVYAIKNKK